MSAALTWSVRRLRGRHLQGFPLFGCLAVSRALNLTRIMHHLHHITYIVVCECIAVHMWKFLHYHNVIAQVFRSRAYYCEMVFTVFFFEQLLDSARHAGKEEAAIRHACCRPLQVSLHYFDLKSFHMCCCDG